LFRKVALTGGSLNSYQLISSEFSKSRRSPTIGKVEADYADAPTPATILVYDESAD